MAMTGALLSPATRDYWDSHIHRERADLESWLGQTWVRRTKINLAEFPEIVPHAVALFETLMLRSQPALIRLYGENGVKAAHYVLQGMMTEGPLQYPNWMQHYYDMRQSIEVDDVLQNHLNQYVSQYPEGWTKEEETVYQDKNETAWPLLPIHAPMESVMEWFNPANMTVTPIRAIVSSHSQEVEGVDDIDGVPYEGLRLGKKGAIQITGVLGQRHEVSYVFNLMFSPVPVAGTRPLHAHVLIERSTELTDEVSLQQMHAMTLAHAVTKSLGTWLNAPLVKQQTKHIKFEPSVSVDCELRDPEANLVWLDIVQDHLKQFMQEAFNVPHEVSSIRRTL